MVLLGMAILLSLLIGVSLGLLGGGGSILTVTILVYALGMEDKEAIATSLVVVAVTSAAALIGHVRAGNVDARIGLWFGAAGMVGAVGGGVLAALISGQVLMVLFALMMLATAVAMLVGGRREVQPRRAELWKIGAQGVAVGFVTGLVGAGGGFLVVPALVLLGGLPMRKAIGTSLLVIALNSAAGTVGHVFHQHIDLGLAATFSGFAVVGAWVGTRLSTRVDQGTLRKGFAALVLVLGVFQLANEIT